MIGLALLLQAAAGGAAGGTGPKVGDTLWITRTVRVAPRQTVRPTEWTPEDPVESVGQPKVTVRGDVVEIQYPLTIWRAGNTKSYFPVRSSSAPGSAVDSLPPYTTTVNITSVLPPAPPDSAISPQPRASVVLRRDRSVIPLLILLALSAVVLLPLRWWWRRRGKPLPMAAASQPVVAVPVDRWVSLGEHRAVASLGAARLRIAVASRRDALELSLTTEARELLDALDRARFGADGADDVRLLVHRAEQLAGRIEQRPAATA